MHASYIRNDLDPFIARVEHNGAVQNFVQDKTLYKMNPDLSKPTRTRKDLIKTQLKTYQWNIKFRKVASKIFLWSAFSQIIWNSPAAKNELLSASGAPGGEQN